MHTNGHMQAAHFFYSRALEVLPSSEVLTLAYSRLHESGACFAPASERARSTLQSVLTWWRSWQSCALLSCVCITRLPIHPLPFAHGAAAEGNTAEAVQQLEKLISTQPSPLLHVHLMRLVPRPLRV